MPIAELPATSEQRECIASLFPMAEQELVDVALLKCCITIFRKHPERRVFRAISCPVWPFPLKGVQNLYQGKQQTITPNRTYVTTVFVELSRAFGLISRIICSESFRMVSNLQTAGAHSDSAATALKRQFAV